MLTHESGEQQAVRLVLEQQFARQPEETAGAEEDKIAVATRLRRVDNRRMEYLRTQFRSICSDDDEVEARCLLAFSLLLGDHLITADTDGAVARPFLRGRPVGFWPRPPSHRSGSAFVAAHGHRALDHLEVAARDLEQAKPEDVAPPLLCP